MFKTTCHATQNRFGFHSSLITCP